MEDCCKCVVDKEKSNVFILLENKVVEITVCKYYVKGLK